MTPTVPRPLRDVPWRTVAIVPGLLGLLAIGGCAGFLERAAESDGADGAPSRSSLQRLATSAANGGNVNVQLVGGVAYVTGRVDSSVEESAIKRVLGNVDGVERVETALQRDM